MTVNLPLTSDQLDDLACVMEDAAEDCRLGLLAYEGKAPAELRRIAATVDFLRGWLVREKAARNAPPRKLKLKDFHPKKAGRTDRMSGPAEIDREAFLRP